MARVRLDLLERLATYSIEAWRDVGDMSTMESGSRGVVHSNRYFDSRRLEIGSGICYKQQFTSSL